jgi:hypothetical protein
MVGPADVARLGAGTRLTVLLLLNNIRLMMFVRSHLSGRNVASATVGLSRALEGLRLLLLAEGDAAADQAADNAEHYEDNSPDGHFRKLLLDFLGGSVLVRLDDIIRARRFGAIISRGAGESSSPRGSKTGCASSIMSRLVDATFDLMAPLSVLLVDEVSAVGNVKVVSASDGRMLLLVLSSSIMLLLIQRMSLILLLSTAPEV